MGELIPVLCESAIPGDIWRIGFQFLLKFTPLVAPIMHVVDVFYHVFFVPNRILTRDEVTTAKDPKRWEDFITGGEDGADASAIPIMAGPCLKGGVGDYLGMPIGVAWPGNNAPCSFPWDAYLEIWNNFYRDENLQAEEGPVSDDSILLVNWEKDYFSSAQLEQQRGTSPAIPITGSSSAVWDGTQVINDLATEKVGVFTASLDASVHINSANGRQNFLDMINDNTVSFTNATPIDIKDLREAFQIQKFMERNQRAGYRYTEFLKAHYDVSPRDDRLQRPEFIGGAKVPVIISEVLQTSEDGTTPQGNMAGKAAAIAQNFVGRYHVKEHGIIMGMLFVRPKASYQQGINRQWLYKTRYDFFFTEFQNISEQAITRNELYTTTVEADNDTIFGYCGAYDEHRTKNDIVCGNFRDTYDYWHMGRQFASAPALNETFIQCVPRKDCFAVQDEDCCLFEFGNLLNVLRPMPIIAEPGFIDHN